MRKLITFYLLSEQQTTIGEHLFKNIKIRVSIYANSYLEKVYSIRDDRYQMLYKPGV
jgi:hypothetical protein